MKHVMLRISAVSTSLLLWALGAFAVPPAPSETGTARTVKYAATDVIPVHTKIRFSTLIVLPQNEDILDFATGDKDFWVVNGAHNLCYVHPAQTGIRTDLHLITSAGHVYSFLLTEIGNDPNTEPDLKLFIEPKEESSFASSNSLSGYVRAADLEAYRKEIQTLRSQLSEEAHAAETKSTERISKFRSEYAGHLRFDYNLDHKAAHEPFLVSAIYHDDAFTYIQCAAHEKPVLYEVKDGKPNLISFQVENGTYIAPKIIEHGYLVVGKKKIAFSKRG